MIPRPVYGALQTISQAMQDTLALGTAISWLRGTKDNDTLDSLTLVMLIILIFAAFPLTLTILASVYGDKDLNPKDHHNHNHHDQLERGEHGKDDNHGTCHTIAGFFHEAFEFTVVGLPFGVLGFGVSSLLRKIWSSKAGCYSVSALVGLVLAWSNYKLHASHIHAKDSYFELIKKVPQAKRRKAYAVSAGVFLGHPCQGFLDGRLFLSSINITNRYVQIFIPSILALLVAIFEGYTEARSTVLLMSEEENEKIINQSWQKKLATLIPAIIHGSLAPIGFIEFLRFIFEQTTKKDLTQFVPLYGRIIILMVAAITLGYTNATGFFNTTVCATAKALDNLPSCCCSTENGNSDEIQGPLLVPSNEDSPSYNQLFHNWANRDKKIQNKDNESKTPNPDYGSLSQNILNV